MPSCAPIFSVARSGVRDRFSGGCYSRHYYLYYDGLECGAMTVQLNPSRMRARTAFSPYRFASELAQHALYEYWEGLLTLFQQMREGSSEAAGLMARAADAFEAVDALVEGPLPEVCEKLGRARLMFMPGRKAK